VPSAELVLKKRYDACFQALKAGQVDAMSTDRLFLKGFKFEDPSQFFMSERFTIEPYGIGIRKGSVTLRTAVNQAITAVRRDNYADLYVKWFHEPLPRNYGYLLGEDPEFAVKAYAGGQ
jgi:putative glutamine transport system substrate-binding protein